MNINMKPNFQSINNMAQKNITTSSNKFPIRIIFPTNGSTSSGTFSANKPSVPSSTSISKAGALYIMNVMNNQRGYTWNNLKQQKEFGRKVAQKILNSPENGVNCNSSIGNGREKITCMLPIKAPILGSLLHEFLLSYGMKTRYYMYMTTFFLLIFISLFFYLLSIFILNFFRFGVLLPFFVIFTFEWIPF